MKKLRAFTVDRIFDVLELVSGIYDFVRNLRKPGPKHDGDTEPTFHLTHKDAERIAEFGRRAGHETKPR
jgi:hypothetical protein